MDRTSQVTVASLEDIGRLSASFRRHLNAANLAPKTVKTYMEGVDLFGRFLLQTGMPTAISAIRRQHVEAFVEHLLQQWKP